LPNGTSSSTHRDLEIAWIDAQGGGERRAGPWHGSTAG
jgi:hypothetical protein